MQAQTDSRQKVNSNDIRVNEVRLEDYRPLLFAVSALNLNFIVDKEQVTVTSNFSLTPLAGAQELVLDGTAKLIKISVNGRKLSSKDYELNRQQLILREFPAGSFKLEIITELYPRSNKSLMGLYMSYGNLFTQCEAEGFRKITYFFDRPDVMTEYTVAIEADATKFPVLLSNGNKTDSGKSAGNRHWVKWHDPFKKPSYLFALVAGKLAYKKTEFITASGRKIDIFCYCDPRDLGKIDFALASVQKAMQWDEERFGLEYDLDTFMVVAVGDFNMGAMENKGLNIFNSKYVLVTSETATDQDFANVENVIGHEYFHNYTGNRVTCRDWFQLTLKEGLTVFRDQEFSADCSSRVERRIKAVQTLRETQFSEDASPLAHPIRPRVYQEINNFYTTTVYEKGAEVVRMLHTILGEENFNRGLRLYLNRHDGNAATCEDFIKAMSDAAKIDLRQFSRWYDCVGTPVVKVKTDFDPETRILSLRLRQYLAKKDDLPLVIPLNLGLIAADGEIFSFRLFPGKELTANTVLLLEDYEQQFELEVFGAGIPILSIGREFSAPVKIFYRQSNKDLLALMRYDPDKFNRWEASQKLYKKYLKKILKSQLQAKNYPSLQEMAKNLRYLLAHEQDAALLALILTLPGFNDLLTEWAPIDPVHLQKLLLALKNNIAELCQDAMLTRCRQLETFERQSTASRAEYNAELEGERALINVLRAYLAGVNINYFTELTNNYAVLATDMTHRIGILTAINSVSDPVRERLLTQFAAEFKQEELVLDKYFILLASSFAADTFTQVKNALTSPYFNLGNPNKVRSLLITFCRNPLFFHRADGQGYAFIVELIIKIERFNPNLAGSLVVPFKAAVKLDRPRQKKIKKALKKLLKAATSTDVRELTEKIYSAL